MKDVMSTALGQKVWFVGCQAGLSTFITLPLMHAAGLASPEGWAQWLVHFLCFFTVWRVVGFLGWFTVLLAAPSSKLLDPPLRR